MVKLLFSILLNSFILLLIAFLLSSNSMRGIPAWVSLACLDCSLLSLDALKTYLVGWVILWLINITIKPILKILSLPFFLLFLWLTIFIVNAIILKLFWYIINELLLIPGISYVIHGWVNFIIAVAIFTFLNMFYSLLNFKK